MAGKLTRDELVQLVRNIIEMKGPDEEIDKWLEKISANVPHPAVSDLIFHSQVSLTPEQIIDQALQYERRVITLPGSSQDQK